MSPPAGALRERGRDAGGASRPGLHPLLRYILKRLLAAAVLIVMLSVAIFLAMATLPGDVPTAILGRGAAEPQVAEISKEYHLQEALPLRYAHWISGFATGDLGHSFGERRAGFSP